MPGRPRGELPGGPSPTLSFGISRAPLREALPLSEVAVQFHRYEAALSAGDVAMLNDRPDEGTGAELQATYRAVPLDV